MKLDVKVPEAGESITEGVLITWFKQDGALVGKDDPLFELETDKITMQVESEAAGRLAIAVQAGSAVEIGQTVATIDTEVAGEPAARSQADGDGAPAVAASEPREVTPPSPAVRRLVEEHGVELEEVEGSGKGGRVTKGDVIAFLERREPAPAAPLTTAPPARNEPPRGVPAPSGGARERSRETRKPMSSLRRRVAERLVQAQQTAAILTTFNEADMSAVLALRERYKEAFAQRHGVKLGFMSFFVKAAVDALKQVPALNGRIEGDEIVQNHYYDIGVAVGTPRGLVVPVLRDADALGFAAVEVNIADLARRAADGKLELGELQGGCFTISNGGVYGSMLSTPILNPPQSGILGMHGIKKRAVVREPDDQIVVRPMMYLALSYDHRLVDGREAVTFLKRVVELIEAPERLMLEI